MASLTTPDYHAAIIGAGFAGIGAAINLDKSGMRDYVIIEAADAPGGTWHWNTYPGVAVDIPSFSYQFSFEQRRNWSRTYALGHELKAYAEHCVDKYRIRSKIRFNTAVLNVAFDDEHQLWRLNTESGEQITARFLINAGGAFTIPNLPDIDGVDGFDGVLMHTARWDHGQDLTGKRVAVIGTGASAVQVIPEIAAKAAHLTVYQRTPIWCFPKPDVRMPRAARWIMRLPGGMVVQRLLSQLYVEVTLPLPGQYATTLRLAKNGAEAIGKRYLRRQVDDPAVRDKLTPRYVVGCKRPGFHNTYLSTYNRDNVELVTEPIDKITPSGVATVGGEHREVDALVLATGFKVMDVDSLSYEVVGRGGMTLRRFWEQNRMQAYEGVSVPGFPNYFAVVGPYGFVGGSWFTMIETQTRHIVRCLERARRLGATQIEVSQAANKRYFDEMIRKRHTQIFWHASCSHSNSYYFDSHGDVPVRRAASLETIWRSRRFPLTDYQFSAADGRLIRR
jgi:cation diffusion facilitator CzcD-associated flavoprotein CzcO